MTWPPNALYAIAPPWTLVWQKRALTVRVPLFYYTAISSLPNLFSHGCDYLSYPVHRISDHKHSLPARLYATSPIRSRSLGRSVRLLME